MVKCRACHDLSAKFYEYASGRIEISNPGGLFGLANAGNFPFMNDYRNPLIAESMRVLGMVNKFNRGIAIVKQDLEHNGNPPAVFDVNKMTEFRVTINAKKSGEINRESGEIKYNTVRNDSVVLEIIRRNPGVKREKIFLELRTSIRSVERALARLKADKVIEYRGSNKTGGWYIRT